MIWEYGKWKIYTFSICYVPKRSTNVFWENASLNGFETVSNCIEDKLNIYLKLFALLYADNTVLMAETHDDLQNILNKFGDIAILGH